MAFPAKGIGASGGKLKELFNPANMKKKVKTSMQAPIKSGGIKIAPEMPKMKKKLTAEKPKLLIAKGANKMFGQKKVAYAGA